MDKMTYTCCDGDIFYNYEYGYGGNCCGNDPYWGFDPSEQECCEGFSSYVSGDVVFKDMIAFENYVCCGNEF